LALAGGVACLWVFQHIHKSAPHTIESTQDPVSPRVRPALDGRNSKRSVLERRSQSANNAALPTPPPSNPAEDDHAALAALDQLAQDVAQGGSPGKVIELFMADSSDRLREAAVRIFAGERMQSFSDFNALPPVFLEALGTALRYEADQDGLARSLDAAWRSTSDPVVRARLDNLENPGLFAARVAEYNLAGNSASALEYFARLESCAHPDTPKYLATLASQPGIDLKDLCDAAWKWSRRFDGLANVPDLYGRMSEPALSSEEQLITAIVLAAAAPGPATSQTLAEAAGHQTSDQWRAVFEDLRNLAAGTVASTDAATDPPAGESVPLPSLETPSPIVSPMTIHGGSPPAGFTQFETLPPPDQGDGRPNSPSSFPGVADQSKSGAGVLSGQAVSSASLSQAPDSREPTVSATDSVWVWRFLAQLAVHDTNAAELLQRCASQGEIPDAAWPGIADTLVSESMQEGHLIPVSSARLSYETEKELNQRLDLIEALLEVTTNRMARLAMQQALLRLSDELPRK
jgi:hypothetical protein